MSEVGKPLDRNHEGIPHPNTTIGYDWFKAFNAHDITTLLALYSDNATHSSPKLPQGSISGKAALSAWWSDAFARLPSLHYRYTSVKALGDDVFLEYVRSVDGEKDTKISEVLTIKDGKIIRSEVTNVVDA